MCEIIHETDKSPKGDEVDTTTPLKPHEAERLYNELLQTSKVHILLRQLRYYSPSDVAGKFGMNAEDVARMAGRKVVG
jgi:hypothetical protein